MIRHIASAVLSGNMVHVIAITDGIALVENVQTLQRTDVAYIELTHVWPAAETLTNFDELAEQFTAEGVIGFIEVLTGSTEWARRVAYTWGQLY